MKKIIKAYFYVTVLVCFYSCNNASKEAPADKENPTATMDNAAKLNLDDLNLFTDSVCIDAGGLANFIISETFARSMMVHYDTIYGRDDSHRPINAMKNNYWIDACTINAIASFLKSSGRHDGIRIKFGCEKDDDTATFPGQQYKKKTTFFIFATTIRPNPSDPSNPDHTNDNSLTIPISSCTNGSEFIKPFAYANEKMLAFDKTYRKHLAPGGRALKDSLSFGVWIDSCVISYLDKLIKTPRLQLDGVNVKLGAYFEKIPNLKSQVYSNQSTIMMVPTSPDGTSHRDNWEVTGAFEAAFQKKFFNRALNHGQLCPNQCN